VAARDWRKTTLEAIFGVGEGSDGRGCRSSSGVCGLPNHVWAKSNNPLDWHTISAYSTILLLIETANLLLYPREFPPVYRSSYLLLSRFLRKHRLDICCLYTTGNSGYHRRTAKRSVSTLSHAHPVSLAISKNSRSRSARWGL